ncbi:MAG: sulfatase [Oligoflexia bacterium]|nr:sulfatase [Oligoflexia bacterium]
MAHMVGAGLLALPMLLACSRGDRPLPAGSTQPDIVLVSIDTLRADHLSAYGYDRPTSPFLDELAAAGTRFEHARSASPWTLPAHTTMFTGQLPWTHRVVEDAYRVDPATPVLPSLLSAAGYRTGGFVSTLYVSSLFGFQRGFDHFDDFGIHTEKANLGGKVTIDRVIDKALDWWSRQPAGKPVFLFLHTYDVHYNYDPPEPFASRFDRPPAKGDQKYKNYYYFKKHKVSDAQLAHQVAQYDESIAWVDSQLRRLDQRLRAGGRTVRWVVTGDHGEEFGERGSWGHAHTLYAEQLHVPLIIAERQPDGGSTLPVGRIVADTVGTQDIAPTIAGWVSQAAGLQADGIDLAPIIQGAAAPDRAFPAETTRFETNRAGLYEDGLRLEWDLKSGSAELFEPATDPKETHDLAAARPLDVARLQADLIALAGRPWTAKIAGTVSSSQSGRILMNGARKHQRVVVGDRFQVLPFDAPVRFQAPGAQVQGPWQAQGGTLPGADAPLSWSAASSGPTGVSMDQATRDALKALGYMQSPE